MSVDNRNGDRFLEGGSIRKSKVTKSASEDRKQGKKGGPLEEISKFQLSNQIDRVQNSNVYTNVSDQVYHGAMLINALNLHKATVKSIKQLSKRQNRFLKERNYSELFNSRYKKETLLQNLRKWGNEIRYYYESYYDWRDRLSDQERERVLAITERIATMVEEVLSLEMENRVLLEKRKNELCDELGAINFYHESLFSVFENRN